MTMSIRPLSKELQNKAVTELNEDSNRVEEDLKYIREWAEKQPHLKVRTDDQWLLGILRGCKFSLERTKEKIDLLCTMKTVTPEFFGNRDPFLPEIQALLKLGVCLPLPKTADPAGPRIVLFRIDSVDPSEHQIEDGIKLTLMILDILMNEDDNFIIAGNHLFIDDKGITVNHVLKITPSIVKKTYTCLYQAYAVRPKGFHVINAPQFAEAAYEMFKPLLSEKISDRVYIYKNNELNELYKSVPLSVLPKEYGGEGGSLQDLIDKWKTKVESYRDWFMEDAQYCSDESKRPGKPRNSSELFGIEGSFRKLDLD